MKMFHSTIQSGLHRILWGVAGILSGALLSCMPASAQECYKPIAGDDVTISVLTGSGICATQICLGPTYNDLQKITDNDLESYADWGNIVSLLSAQGVSVKATAPYSAGTVAGFVLSRNGVANLALLNDLTITTYLNGVLKETKSVGGLLSGSLLGNEEKFYATFITGQSFDEIRLNTNLLSAGVINGLKIYAALGFDQNCHVEDNKVCLDYINGPGTAVTYDGSLVCVLCNFTNPGNLVDGDKSNYALLTKPVAALNVSAGVLDRRNVYPAGSRAGFIIAPNGGGNILSAEVLGMLTVETYLFGQKQESHAFSSSGSGLLSLSLLSGSNSQKQKLGFTTTKPFNEVRLKVNQVATVDLGALRIYGAFEEPANCTDCITYLTSSATGKYKVEMVDNVLLGKTWNGNTGLGLLGNGLSNEGNVISANDNSAKIDLPTLGLGAGSIISVKTSNNDKFPVGTYAGFTISKESGLLSVGLLDKITVKAYDGTTQVGSQSGSALLSASVLGGGSGKSIIGFYPPQPFNRIVFEIDYGGLSIDLGSVYRVHNVFVIEDTDNDGTPDCIDQCATGSDHMDTDGDGIPDACDNAEADVITIIELLPPPPTGFHAGDTIAYRITVTNLGPATAQNVNIVNNAPNGTTISHWTGTSTSGVSLPATSGTGNLSQTISSLPKGDSIVYIVTVQTPIDYGYTDIRSSVEVTTSTPDPDPTCPRCTTPGLPLIISPDLVVSAVMPFSSFSSLSPQRNLTLTVQEIAGVGTEGVITLYIPKSSNYSLSYDANATTIELASGQEAVSVSNKDWSFDNSNPDFYILTSKVGISVAESGFSRVGLKATNTSTGAGSTSIINVNIANKSGGERNNENNATGKILSFD